MLKISDISYSTNLGYKNQIASKSLQKYAEKII